MDVTQGTLGIYLYFIYKQLFSIYLQYFTLHTEKKDMFDTKKKVQQHALQRNNRNIHTRKYTKCDKI